MASLFALSTIVLIVSATVLFFGSRWLIKRTNLAQGRNRNLFSLVITLVGMPLFFGSCILFLSLTNYWYFPCDFDPVKWEEKADKRYRMGKDLANDASLLGKSREEIKALLGPGEEKINGNIRYKLGLAPGFLVMDPDHLLIHLEYGKVVKVEHQKG